jgi:hypothetical protein
MNWPSPGNDPYYAANSTENTARRTFYNINAVPHMVIDGDTLLYSQAHSYTTWDGLISTRLGVSSPIELNFVTEYDTTVRTGTVTWTAIAKEAISQTNLKLRMAITESDLWYAGTNGDPVHHEVMRDMVADANGDTLTLVNAGDSITRIKSFSINPAWDAKNCQIILWIQTDTWSGRTKQMLQGAKEWFGSRLEQKGYTLSQNKGLKDFYIVEPGTSFTLSVRLRNEAGPGIDASCHLSTTNPYVTITNGIFNIGSMGVGDSVNNNADPFAFSIDPATPNGSIADMVITKHITNPLFGFTTIKYDTVRLIIGTTTTNIFFDDFENGLGNWTRGGTGGTVNWDTTSLQSYSPTYCITDSRSGNYTNNISRYAQLTNGIDMTPYNAALLSWWERYSTEDGYDFCRPEYSLDGTNWYALTPIYSGTKTTWTQKIADISDYCAAGSMFRMRFRLTSDGSVVGDGWYVDDVSVDVFLNTGVSGGPVGTPVTKNYLASARPNPTFGPARIIYQLAAPGAVSLSVYNVAGRLVRTLENSVKKAGSHTVTWDGRDSGGNRVANGVYLYRLTASNYTATRKLTIVR